MNVADANLDNPDPLKDQIDALRNSLGGFVLSPNTPKAQARASDQVAGMYRTAAPGFDVAQFVRDAMRHAYVDHYAGGDYFAETAPRGNQINNLWMHLLNDAIQKLVPAKEGVRFDKERFKDDLAVLVIAYFHEQATPEQKETTQQKMIKLLADAFVAEKSRKEEWNLPALTQKHIGHIQQKYLGKWESVDVFVGRLLDVIARDPKKALEEPENISIDAISASTQGSVDKVVHGKSPSPQKEIIKKILEEQLEQATKQQEWFQSRTAVQTGLSEDELRLNQLYDLKRDDESAIVRYKYSRVGGTVDIPRSRFPRAPKEALNKRDNAIRSAQQRLAETDRQIAELKASGHFSSRNRAVAPDEFVLRDLEKAENRIKELEEKLRLLEEEDKI